VLPEACNLGEWHIENVGGVLKNAALCLGESIKKGLGRRNVVHTHTRAAAEHRLGAQGV
jgi:hypothetical protein